MIHSIIIPSVLVIGCIHSCPFSRCPVCQPPSHVPFLISCRAIIILRFCCSSMLIKSSKSREAEEMAPCEWPAPGILFLLLSHWVPLWLFSCDCYRKEDVREQLRGRGITLEVYSAPKVKFYITSTDLISSLYKQICWQVYASFSKLCVRMHIYSHDCGGQKTMSDIVPQASSIFPLNQGPLTAWDLQIRLGLMASEPPRIWLFHWALDYNSTPVNPAFYFSSLLSNIRSLICYISTTVSPLSIPPSLSPTSSLPKIHYSCFPWWGGGSFLKDIKQTWFNKLQ